jgi:hypothetical protein
MAERCAALAGLLAAGPLVGVPDRMLGRRGGAVAR